MWGRKQNWDHQLWRTTDFCSFGPFLCPSRYNCSPTPTDPCLLWKEDPKRASSTLCQGPSPLSLYAEAHLPVINPSESLHSRKYIWAPITEKRISWCISKAPGDTQPFIVINHSCREEANFNPQTSYGMYQASLLLCYTVNIMGNGWLLLMSHHFPRR